MSYSKKFILFRIKISTWAVRFIGWLQSGNIRRNKPRTELLKGKMLTKYFAKKYVPVVKNLQQGEATTETPETIWQFWDNPAGKATPEIVKSCLESAEKFKGNFEHRILDSATLCSYSDLPDFVFDRLRKGQISYTHFSDLLRLNLLKNHGGIWLDATGYMTDFMPKYILDEDFFVFLTDKSSRFLYAFIQNCFIRSKKGSALCEAWYQTCVEFWKNATGTMDYFQHQLMFKALVQNDSQAAALFAEMPHVSEDETHRLIQKLLQKFDATEWENIKKASFFQKTTYKVATEVDYSDTYFSKLCKGKI